MAVPHGGPGCGEGERRAVGYELNGNSAAEVCSSEDILQPVLQLLLTETKKTKQKQTKQNTCLRRQTRELAPLQQETILQFPSASQPC